MKVLEVFKNIDKNTLIQGLMERHPSIFTKYDEEGAKEHSPKSIEYTANSVEVFLNDIFNDVKPYKDDDEEFKEYRDFVILVNELYDDDEYDGKSIFDVYHDHINIEDMDINKVGKSIYVDAAHMGTIKSHTHLFDMPYEEYKKLGTEDFEKNFITTYGLDFLSRRILLNLEVAEPCIERYGLDVVAIELYFEMTFYGLTEESIKEREQEVFDRVDKVEGVDITKDLNLELIEADDLLEEKEAIDHNEIDYSIKFSYWLAEYNYNLKNKYMKEYYEWGKNKF